MQFGSKGRKPRYQKSSKKRRGVKEVRSEFFLTCCYAAVPRAIHLPVLRSNFYSHPSSSLIGLRPEAEGQIIGIRRRGELSTVEAGCTLLRGGE